MKGYAVPGGVTGKPISLGGSVGREEVVWISDIYELPVKGMGKKYVLSARVKIDSLIADSLDYPSYAIGFTWTWHTKVVGPNTGWNEKRAEDYKCLICQLYLIRQKLLWRSYHRRQMDR